MDSSLTTSVSTLMFHSPAFEENTEIPQKYTAFGENINPPFMIQNVDADAKSLVLIVDDPDAPSGTFDHWIKFNISPETAEIEEGKEPQGVSGVGTIGTLTYTGPKPPQGSGVHRYQFKLYALDTKLELDEGVTKDQVERAMTTHIIQQAEVIGLYAYKE